VVELADQLHLGLI